MKKGTYFLCVIVFLLGTSSILAGLGVINILSSDHHLRYELGGALVDLLAISAIFLLSVKELKAKLQRISTFFVSGEFEDRELKSSDSLLVTLFLGLLGIAAFVLILWITPYGSGVYPDSITYINLGKNIFSGKGYSLNGLPQTHFPPLYSLFLAATNLITSNFVQAARILNAILFGINIGLIALAIFWTTDRRILTTLFAVFFFLSSAPLLDLHAMAYSEPLFITFSLASIILLRLYVNKLKLSLLVAASLFLGFGFITRYIGIAFLPAIIAIVLFSGSGRQLRRKFLDTIICLVLACTPLFFFLIRNTILAGSATDRMFYYHPFSFLNYVTDLRDIAINFIAPISLPVGVTLATFGLITALLIAQVLIHLKRNFKDINWRSMVIVVPVSCLLFSVFYLLFLYISISFMDASTPVDARILSPILCLLIVGVFSAIWTVSKTLKTPLLWWGFLLCVVFSISLKTPDAIRSAAGIRENGLGFTSRQWQTSETVAFIKSVPENLKIYTNGADVVGFLTEKVTIYIPNKSFPITRQANSLYDGQLNAMCKLVIEKGALLVYFNQISWRWYLPSQKQVNSACKLTVLHNFSDGIVYGEK
jgi:hypothetical protein